MRIRTKLSVSYFVIITVTGVLMILLAREMVDGLAERNLESAKQALAELEKANLKLTKEKLTSSGERTVRLKCKEVAAILALMLKGKDLSDYDRLRRDPELREVATQSVYSPDGEAGYVDVLDNKGVSVLHPNKTVEGRNFEEWKVEFPKMWELVKRSFTEKTVTGYYRFIDRQNRERRKFLALHHIPDTPFIVCTVVNIDQYFLPVHKEIRSAQVQALQGARLAITAAADSTLDGVMKTGVVAGLVFIAVVGGLAVWMAGTMAGPVMHLCNGVEQIGEGNFQARVSEKGSDEVRELARTFNQLGNRLTGYMENLKEATASRQRIESELTIAAEIQRSLIPRTFPPFPEHDEFEIYALMQPARQVGGDFYDFFFLNDSELFFTVCDVSGKGVPAAIFMAVTRSLLGAAARSGLGPRRVLARVNKEIHASNDTYMFATVFCGIFNVGTGTLVYANAGHNPPLLIRGPDRVEFLGRPSGPVLGLFEDEFFSTEKLVLAPGNTLFVFTDGVTEAAGPDEGFFSRERLVRSVSRCADEGAERMIAGVLNDITEFAGGAPQWDDMTMLAVRYLKRT